MITVEQHILREQQRVRGATGEFSLVLSGITLATKLIQAKIRRAGLEGILGAQGRVNVQGEVQQKLDVYANEALLRCLSDRASIGMLASEENKDPIFTGHGSPQAKYAVVFDPLDGSSNIDVNVSVGTIFSVLRRPPGTADEDLRRWVLQPGSKQVAAGYVVYGSSTMLVYTVGNGVNGFTLDPGIGDYVLSHENLRMPGQGKYYSVNEALAETFPRHYSECIDRLRRGALGRRYPLRYIGSLVSDFHRTLLTGGIYMYPPTSEHPSGKLRLMYEANPIAMIAEQAGGRASDGQQRLLDIQPRHIHQRTPMIVGGTTEMEEFERCLAEVCLPSESSQIFTSGTANDSR